MARKLFRSHRIDHRADPRDTIGREAALLGMRLHGRLVGRVIDAVDLVVGDVTMDPLDLRSHAVQHAAGLLRDRFQFVRWQFSSSAYPSG